MTPEEEELTRLYGARGVLDHLGYPIRKDKSLVPIAAKHRVTLIQDHVVVFPDLYLEVFLTGPVEDQLGFPQLLARAMCSKASLAHDSDLVIFTGGADVNPELYGAKAHPKTAFNEARDADDMELYAMCLNEGIPMLGICRGAQFLHVMNGGKLYQDVDNHFGDHPITDVKTKEIIDKVSSVHHQMVIENTKGGMEVLATNAKAENHWVNNTLNHKCRQPDVEAFYYPATGCLGIQGHPEYYGYPHFARWALRLIEECFIINSDVDWKGSHRRLKPDIMELREVVPHIGTPIKIKEKQ